LALAGEDRKGAIASIHRSDSGSWDA
jgi:hypothetical protein